MCSVFFLFWESPPNFTINPLSANPTKWPNKLKLFVGKLPTNCLSVFGHIKKLALKGLILSKFRLIEQLPFPLKSSENHNFSDDFRKNRSQFA